MKSLFPGYYAIDPRRLDDVWTNGRVVLDANVLLNLYRYSDASAKELQAILQLVRPRLWLPYQAALEFHRNRLRVISKQTQTYPETSKALTVLLERLENAREHPFVPPDVLERFQSASAVTCLLSLSHSE